MLPAPMVLPSDHCPVAGAVMVVLLFGVVVDAEASAATLGRALSAATPLMGMVEVVDASDAYRVWPLLEESGCEGAAPSLD